MASKNFPPLGADGFNRVTIQGTIEFSSAGSGSLVATLVGNGFTATKIGGQAGTYEIRPIDPFFQLESALACCDEQTTPTFVNVAAIGRDSTGWFFWVQLFSQDATSKDFVAKDPDTGWVTFSMVLKNTGINSK